MATLAELRQMCEELEIDSSEISREEMIDKIKEAADKKFDRKKKMSIKGISKILLKFLMQEYDYILRDKEGKDVEYD